MLSSLEKYSHSLQSFDLEKFIPREITHLNMNLDDGIDVRALTQGLSCPIWDMFDRRGKALCSHLCLIVSSMLSLPYSVMVPLAHCVEIIHTASLIFDDIEDNSKNRRGKPCTHLLFGLDRAVNLGTYIYFLPLSIISSLNIPEDSKYRLIKTLSQETNNMHYGQTIDIEWNKDDFIPSESQYIKMVSNKASGLVRLASKFPLTLSNPSQDLVKVLVDHSDNLGICFQIWDDLLNLTSVEYAKKRSYLGEDISEGKKTLIVIRALKENKRNSERLKAILKSKTNDQELVKEAIGIIKETDALEYCEEFSRKILNESWGRLDKVFPDSQAKEDLHTLSFNVINRKV